MAVSFLTCFTDRPASGYKHYPGSFPQDLWRGRRSETKLNFLFFPTLPPRQRRAEVKILLFLSLLAPKGKPHTLLVIRKEEDNPQV